MNYFEQIGIPYELHSDGFYYPKLAMPEQKPAHYGRYGLLHKQFLQEHRPLAYDTLLSCGELVSPNHWNGIRLRIQRYTLPVKAAASGKIEPHSSILTDRRNM